MDRVTRAEAARKLGVNRATVTKWVRKNPELLDEGDMVSVLELQTHRDANIDPRLQTSSKKKAQLKEQSGTLDLEADDADADTDDLPGKSERPTSNESRGDKELMNAAIRGQELAEKLGMVLARNDVERAISDAIAAINETMNAAIDEQARDIAGMSDRHEVRMALTEMLASAIEAAAKGLSTQLGSQVISNAA